MYRKPTWSSRAPDMGCSKEENQQGALCSKTAGGMSNHLALGSCDCVLLKHWSKLCLQAASAAAFTHQHWALGCCSSGTCRAFYHAPTPAPLLHRLNCPLLHRKARDGCFTVPFMYWGWSPAPISPGNVLSSKKSDHIPLSARPSFWHENKVPQQTDKALSPGRSAQGCMLPETQIWLNSCSITMATVTRFGSRNLCTLKRGSMKSSNQQLWDAYKSWWCICSH